MNKNALRIHLAVVTDISDRKAILHSLHHNSIYEVKVPTSVNVTIGDLIARVNNKYIFVPHDCKFSCQAFDARFRLHDNDPIELIAVFMWLALVGMRYLQLLVTNNEPQTMLASCIDYLDKWLSNIWTAYNNALDMMTTQNTEVATNE